ncbi:MAG: hypothetical protein JWQ08_2762 [Deinococcus sp.]|jgi:hypothetical protein|uniref:DUF1540 domain-containing protein n=1 Tax=Deinococcus puniceus TaxID=1182568 RepID=A0A172T9I4_9DEIO|nr:MULTISPECIES: DUF1540 domain-containing protein [Deinococcus]ANE43473.1 hypothetical protein SU48_06500 [Deinococcus puniceus]MDB5046712.1 hypothetical protein [Deinococcus sp.]UQN05883.1 DUF1540 domain-containing protein [Deinococcus sp. QL22]
MNDTSKSLVSRCDATSCRYNEDMQCHAGQIEVQMVMGEMGAQMAHCMTFAPEDGADMTQGMQANPGHD